MIKAQRVGQMMNAFRNKKGHSYKKIVIPAKAGIQNILKILDSRFHGNDDQKGLTLIEVMIALVILLLISLALMQTALVSIDSNMLNVLRDEVVSIAEGRMDEARNIPFDSLADDALAFPVGANCPAGFPVTGVLIERDFRNIADFDFCTNRDVTTLNSDNKEVTITVGWIWKGNPYTHTISTIVRKQ